MINARPRRRSRLLLLVSLLVTVLGLVAAGPASATQRPTSIPLPNGFSPEDITNGRGSTFYVGSLAAGGIYQGDFRTGQGHLLVTSADGPTTGLFLERRAGQHDRLWAAGGPSGEARVYDAGTGALLRTYRLAAPGSGSFISDMVVTDRAAYYTDSFVQQMYVIPLGRNGALSAPSAARTVPVTGDVTYQPGANTFNLNGIALVDGTLVMGQTVTGKLFAVNPSTGRAREIPLVDRTGQPVTVNGADGIAQRGNTLVIAQNFPQKIAIVQIGQGARSARLSDTLTDPRLDIPSSVTVDGGDVFALNARFTTPAGPTTTYNVVRL